MEQTDIKDEKGAHDLEIKIISELGRLDNGTGILLNLTNGGEGCSGIIPWNKGKRIGSCLTDEGKEKISKANKGIPKNHGSKVSLAMSGKEKSKEHKKKISEALKGNMPWNKGMKGVQESHWKGKQRSIETKQKMSEAQKGKSISDAHKAQISKAHKGKVLSEETKRKMSESRTEYWRKRREQKKDED